jgi:hemolysin III
VGEEIANSLLHGLGAILACGGMVLLILRANSRLGGSGGGGITLTAYVIFASAMIGMFLASTLYHAQRHERAKRIFRVLDHGAIYLFIAGTYTPFCLLGLRGVRGWVFFGIEWLLAITGIILYARNCKILKKAELFVYIAMGWAIVAAWVPLARAIPFISAVLLAAGGAAYTLGTIWYSIKNRRGTHVTWHVFVLAGAACHWWSIWFMS